MNNTAHPLTTGQVVWMSDAPPFCQCYHWSPEEVKWRSRTHEKRVCVWCAARRPANDPQKG